MTKVGFTSGTQADLSKLSLHALVYLVSAKPKHVLLGHSTQVHLITTCVLASVAQWRYKTVQLCAEQEGGLLQKVMPLYLRCPSNCQIYATLNSFVVWAARHDGTIRSTVFLSIVSIVWISFFSLFYGGSLSNCNHTHTCCTGLTIQANVHRQDIKCDIYKCVFKRSSV